MKYFIISDIHANLEALDAVLQEARGETMICLGDVVGYGPDPVACIHRIRQLDIPSLMGNHDKAQLDLDQLRYFNPLARISAMLTSQELSETDMTWLSTRPEELIRDDLYFTHSSPYDPSRFYYLMPGDTASPYLILSFAKLAPLGISTAFVGHTHIPGIFTMSEEGRIRYVAMVPGQVHRLDEHRQHIINCPSVGQPRNHHSEAQYVLFDSETLTVELIGVPYDIPLTTQKMRQAGIPEELWRRLLEGI